MKTNSILAFFFIVFFFFSCFNEKRENARKRVMDINKDLAPIHTAIDSIVNDTNFIIEIDSNIKR